MGELSNSIGNLLRKLGDTGADLLQESLSTAGKISSEALKGAVNTTASITEHAVDGVENMATKVVANSADITEAGVNVGYSAGKEVIGKVSDIKDNIVERAGRFSNVLKSDFNGVLATLGPKANEVKSNITSKLEKLSERIDKADKQPSSDQINEMVNNAVSQAIQEVLKAQPTEKKEETQFIEPSI